MWSSEMGCGDKLNRLRTAISIAGVAIGLSPACVPDSRNASVEDAGAMGAGFAGKTGNGATAGSTGMAGAVSAGRIDGGTDTSIEGGPFGPSESWTGYIEQYSFSSGSDALKLTFSTDDHGVAVGAVVFGQGTPPAPATNPDVGYPPDFLQAARDHRIDAIYLAEGYSYAFDAGKLDGQRLQFSANLAQLWSGWCALQTSPAPGYGPCFLILSGQGGGFQSADLSMCTVNNFGGTGQELQVDCGKICSAEAA
jgi:hypothetical protein